jgi:hypothetical protein
MGCSSLKHIESSEFKRQIELNNMQTLYWSQYIGQADGRAFILRKRVPLIGKKMKEEVLFTETDQLEKRLLRNSKKESRTTESTRIFKSYAFLQNGHSQRSQ